MESIYKNYLDKLGLIKLLNLLKITHYTKKEVDTLLKGLGGSGGSGESYDDTELRQWIKNNYIEKGDDSESLIQADGDFRNIFDGDSFADSGVGTEIPTVRSIKQELTNYLKNGDINLDDYEKTSDLLDKLTNLKSEILGGAGEDYDTLKEIEEWVKEHEDLYQALISTVSQKATKEEIKDMATQTYVNEEFEKIAEELDKKCTVVVCDNQYEFDSILTKDNNTIYLIKGDQDQWFSKEDGDELYDFYGELLERVVHLERLNGITDYNNESDNDGDE